MLTILLFFLLPFISYAQLSTNNFKSVPMLIDGQESYGAWDIIQDEQGYMWLITSKGLTRYDGYEFKLYKNDPGDSTSLTGAGLEVLFVAKDGTLWIGTHEGLSKYDLSCDCFTHYEFKSEEFNANQDYTSPSTVIDITEDHQGNMWVAVVGGGLLRYDPEQDLFIRYLNNPKGQDSISQHIVREVLGDSKGNLWIGTGIGLYTKGDGIIRFNPQTGAIKRFVHDPSDSTSLLDNRISELYEDRKGRVWAGTYRCGLHYFDEKTGSFVRMMKDENDLNKIHAPFLIHEVWLDDPFVNIIHEDQNGGFWVGTIGKGINYFDARTGKLKFFDPTEIEEDLFKFYRKLYETRQGQIWVGSNMANLYKLDLYGRRFTKYPKLAGAQRSFESKVKKNIVWVGTLGDGLKSLNLQTDEIIEYKFDANKESIRDNAVRGVYEDLDGQLWIGLGQEVKEAESRKGKSGLDRMDIQTGKFFHYEINKDPSSPSETVFTIQEDRQGYLWLGTGPGGLYRSDAKKENFMPFKINSSSAAANKESIVYYVSEADGKIWANDESDRTLYYFNYEQNQFIPFLKGFGTNFIEVDQKGWYWIGTWEQGLIHLNPADTSFTHYTTKDGLPSNGGVHVLQAGNGVIWAVTQKGLAVFNPETKRFETKGLPYEYFHESAFKLRDGRLVFTGHSGVYICYPDEVMGNPYPPELFLSGLQVSGETYNLSSYWQDNTHPIQLSFHQNDLSFDYEAFHYSNPSQNQFRYKLIPYDLDWIEAGTQRSVRYTNLDAGDYTFQLQATSSDGVWNEHTASMNIQIHPRWWMQWWVLLGFALALASIGIGFYRFQLSRKLAVAESLRLKEINRLKTSLYNNITHEFRTPLTVILGMVDQLKATLSGQEQEVEKPLELIRRNGESLLRLVNELLDLAKLESGNLKLELIQSDVIPFVKYLGESFHSMAQEKQVNLMVYAEVKSLQMDFDTAKLSAIISNLLSNAIKFTPAHGKVIIHLNQIQKKEKPYFVIKVQDNGIGIAEEDLAKIFSRFYQVDASSTREGEGTGIGLNLTKELVDLMGGKIEVNSTLGEGSEFIVQLPISQKAPLQTVHSKPSLTALETAQVAEHDLPVSSTTQSDLPLVLIIEDNADLVHYLTNCLGNNYQTIHAENGELGIEKAIANLPDLILCDVMMPRKDGYEVCAILKSDERTDHIPIIMLTAKVTDKDRLMGLSQGADAYLAKPFKQAELFTRIDQLILLRQKMMRKMVQHPFSQFLSQKTEKPEAKFLQRVIAIILKNIDSPIMGAALLAQQLHLSESQVYRKLKAISGQSPALFIRKVRLQQAKEMILSTDMGIAEVAYATGFNDPSWFARVFKEEFGYVPSSVRK